MRNINEEVKLLKQSEKSVVYLVRDKAGEQAFIRKILKGQKHIYSTLQDCSHPYLPKLYEVVISDDATTIIEEYIEGQSLGSAKLSEKQLLGAIKELCSVLEFLHGKNVIHRDIKPSNIILAEDGHIRLIDFDAARIKKEGLEQDTKLLGTRGYAPPEQYGFSQTDARTDIYSLGVTLEQLLEDKAQRPRYRRITQKCTNLNPDQRYQSVKEVRSALAFNRRGIVLLSVVIVISLLSYGLLCRLSPLPAREAEVASFPSEELLFYTQNGEYIIKGPDEDESIPSVSMRVDMTSQGNFVDFVIPESLNNWIDSGMRYDLGYILGDLADGVQASFWRDGKEVSLWPVEMEFLMDDIPYDPFVLTEVKPMTQITCADADGDGIKELFVSKGNREHTLVTSIWRLADIKNKSFEYVGVMWGTHVMYLYENGDIRAIVSDVQLNHYHYSDGILSVISEVGFEEFKASQKTSHLLGEDDAAESLPEPADDDTYGEIMPAIKDFKASSDPYKEFWPKK